MTEKDLDLIKELLEEKIARIENGSIYRDRSTEQQLQTISDRIDSIEKKLSTLDNFIRDELRNSATFERRVNISLISMALVILGLVLKMVL